MAFKEIGYMRLRIYMFGSVMGQEEGPSGSRNELLGAVKGEEFFSCLSNYELLKHRLLGYISSVDRIVVRNLRFS